MVFNNLSSSFTGNTVSDYLQCSHCFATQYNYINLFSILFSPSDNGQGVNNDYMQKMWTVSNVLG